MIWYRFIFPIAIIAVPRGLYNAFIKAEKITIEQNSVAYCGTSFSQIFITNGIFTINGIDSNITK